MSHHLSPLAVASSTSSFPSSGAFPNPEHLFPSQLTASAPPASPPSMQLASTMPPSYTPPLSTLLLYRVTNMPPQAKPTLCSPVVISSFTPSSTSLSPSFAEPPQFPLPAIFPQCLAFSGFPCFIPFFLLGLVQFLSLSLLAILNYCSTKLLLVIVNFYCTL